MMEFVDCRTCKTDCVRADSVYGYTFCDKYTHPPITNADRIRAMSDEELAVFLSMDLKQPCDYCQLADFEGACTETLCEDAMMKWLQQPTEKQKEDD